MIWFTVSVRGLWDKYSHMLSTSITSPRLSLPRLNNPGGQVEFLGNESRGWPSKAFGARILARVNESPGDALVDHSLDSE